MKIATDIGAKRFVPFLRECRSRCFWYAGDKNQARASIEEALTEVEALNAEAFIGAWVLGTCALLSETAVEAKDYLSRADLILENGCVGHNYYRFYTQAIDTTLRHGMYERTRHYITAFREFLKDEPCPWSDFYLKRGDLLLTCYSSKIQDSEIVELIDTAKSLQLLSAIPMLENALVQ